MINELTHLRTNRIVLNNFSKIDTLIDRNKNEFLLDTNDDELMKILTSICLVSKNFANSFFKNETLSKKELSTFYKYFLRMISRSIPFGNMVSIRSNGTTKKDIVEMDYLRFEILFEEKIVKNKKNLIKLTTTIKNSNAIRLNNTYFANFKIKETPACI